MDNQDTPIFRLRSLAGSTLYFLGVRHTNDLFNLQFKEMKQAWEEFLTSAKTEKLAIIEGVLRPTLPSTFEEAVKLFGESGALQWLAKDGNIPVVRLEPAHRELCQELCGLFDSQLVAYTFIAQGLASWFHQVRQSTLDGALVKLVDKEMEFSDIYNFTPSLKWFFDFHAVLFEDTLLGKLKDKDFLRSITNPLKEDSSVNSVITAMTRIRNIRIFAGIKQEWQKGWSLFITYGKGHFSALKDQLESLK